MKAISLGYHDVLFPGIVEKSGFASSTGMHYKLPVGQFREHMDEVAGARFDPPGRVTDVASRPDGAVPFYLTFDDGGVSALHIADELDRRGWTGHFFVTTDFIGTDGFLSAGEIREVHRRGHMVGTHSCSHPVRMSTLTTEMIADEWRRSTAVLTGILGEPIAIASVPGGDFSTAVARCAAEAGIVALFTSEPVTRTHDVQGCRVYGRYAVTRGVSAPVVAAIALGRLSPRLRQYTLWNLKKVVKSVAGNRYSALQKRIFELAGRRPENRPS
jgi:peptidoglycan/xylan/chitin deacetylase (PgdA/CDA1 family)